MFFWRTVAFFTFDRPKFDELILGRRDGRFACEGGGGGVRVVQDVVGDGLAQV